jgi:hypothetical protein
MIQYLHSSSLPSLVVHADWSSNSKKRIMARATKAKNGSYLVKQSEMVGDLNNFLARLRTDIEANGSILVGFDFPIGLPIAYARAARISSFTSALPQLGQKDWSDFYRIAETPNQIHLKRPFYPKRPGSARRSHLISGLGLSDFKSLYRLCELGKPGRRAACPLFWTLGAQQVGKAAISGWKDILSPALLRKSMGVEHSHLVSIWPFSGILEELLQTRSMVVLETYPSEFYNHLELNFTNQVTGKPSGKRDQVVRASNAVNLLSFAAELDLHLDPSMQASLLNGFGSSPSGEDFFDAAVGLLGMLNILLGNRPFEEPDDPNTRNIEGWIFGQLRL